MAIEWTTAEAVKKVREDNGAAIVDLGKRFPLFTHFASNVNAAGVELMVLSGLTPQQWNNKLKALINTDETGEVEQEEVKEPVRKATRGRKPVAAKAAPKKRAPKKVEPVEDLDDEDLDEDEEEDEELEEVKPAPKKRAPKKAAPKKRAPRKPVVIEEDDEEEDLEDDEEEFDDFDDFDDMEEF